MLKNQSQNQEDDFYSELDEKTENSSCCTCQTMAILFSILLIIVILLSVWLGKELKTFNWKFWQKYTIKNSQTINNKLKEFENNPEIEIIFTSKELTSLINKSISNLYFELKNPEFNITQENIILNGKLVRPLKSDIKIDLLPEIRNEKVYLKVTNVAANNITLPTFLNGELEKVLNNLIESQFKSIYDKYIITNVDLETDKLIIKGKIKEVL